MAVPLTLDADRPGLLETLAARIVADAAGRRPVVVMDGGSGSGKTRLAAGLHALLSSDDPAWQLVDDDFYPGWTGLSAAWTVIPQQVLAARDPGYRPWDWRAGAEGPRHPLDPYAPILVEGCGALTPESAARASTAIWIEMAPDARRRRALGRDGDMFAPWWSLWEIQEELHWARHHPQRLAGVRILGEAVSG